MIFILIFVEICLLHLIFQYGKEIVLIQRTIIGFEAILQNLFEIFQIPWLSKQDL